MRIEISDFVIRTFVPRFHISSALKAANAYKQKGFPVIEIFQYLFLLIFSNRSMYMNLITGRNTPAFAKDTVYRFMKMTQINWMRFTTIVASRIIKTAIEPLTGEDRTNVLILDDSTSAVDTATDARIRRAFAEEIPDTTKLIIAQRISSIQSADRIIVMDEGKISGFGTHEELMKTNAIYQEVYNSQIKGGGDFDENRGGEQA